MIAANNSVGSSREATLKLASDGLCWLAFAIVFIAYCVLANHLRGGLDFNDETEKVVAAEMIARGGHMYRDVFSQHGPFSFMLAHAPVGSGAAVMSAQYRFLPLLMACGSVLALLFTPAVRSVRSRVWVTTAFLLGLIACQTIWSLMMGLYQVFAGHLFVWGLSLLVIPLLVNAPLRRWAAFAGGASFAFAFFCAYSFSLSIACLALACIIHMATADGTARTVATAWLRWAFVGACAASVIMLLWLAVYGDLIGYFTYHFYLNQFIYKRYMTHGLLLIVALLLPGYNYYALITEYKVYGHDMPYNAFLFCMLYTVLAISVALFAFRRRHLAVSARRSSWQQAAIFIFLLAGLIYTDPRGATEFQAATIVIVIVALVPMLAALLNERNALSRCAVVISLGIPAIALIGAQIFAVTHCYFLSPIGYYQNRGVLSKSEAADMQFVRQLVGPDEPVQSLPFHPLFYIQADRWPASGYFYVLPWQMDYAAQPILNRSIDICADLAARRPKFIFNDQDAVWGHSTDSYMQCVTTYIAGHYVKTFRFKDGWVRADLVADDNAVRADALITQSNWPGLSMLQADSLEQSITRLARLQTDHNACLLHTAAGEFARLGECDDRALQVAIPLNDEGLLKTLPDYLCLESIDQTDASVRLWPCMGGTSQEFTIQPAGQGFRLQNARSGLCLQAVDNKLMQTNCDAAVSWHWDKD